MADLEQLPEALVMSPGYLFGRLAGEALRRFNAALKREGMMYSDYRVIEFLGKESGVSQIDIARVLRVDRSNVVEIIDRLERRGAVIRGLDEIDRRRYSVSLTAAGRELLEQSRELIQAADEKMTDALTAAERRKLVNMLGRVFAD